MNTYADELRIALEIAREAGPMILKYFDGEQQVEIKSDKTQVTIADKLINSMVIERLIKAFPEDGIIGEEESTSEYGGGRKWFCDPIDGTAAFVQGVPTAMFSLALVIDGKPVIGVAYDPFLNRMYVGEKGKQSTCNGKPISVSKEGFATGTVAITGGIRGLAKRDHWKKMLTDGLRLCSFSGAVYKCCLVSRGRLIGYVEHGVNAHDAAAIHCIVEGAGGKITSIEGTELDYSKPFKGVIASNGIIHDKLVEYCRT